jgi:hypothetical protein
MYRLWDEVHSTWVAHNGKSIWSMSSTPNKVRDRLIAGGRNPDTLKVERVHVEVK